MSWFRKALTITTVYEDSFYTAIDPGEFYEWKFTGIIPQGKIFTKRLPESSIFTEGYVIATARLPESALVKSGFGFETKQPIKSDIFIQAGQIQTPKEIIDRYHKIRFQLDNGVEIFKNSISSRPYFVNNEHIYHVSSSGDKARMTNYGPVKKISEQLSELRVLLNQQSLKKSGRAFEMSDFRRFENAMTFLDNVNVPVDSLKIETILKASNISPQNSKEVVWSDCFLEISNDARMMNEILKRYESLSWVRTALDKE